MAKKAITKQKEVKPKKDFTNIKHIHSAIILLIEATARLLAGYFIASAYSTTFTNAVAIYFVVSGLGVIVMQFIKKG